MKTRNHLYLGTLAILFACLLMAFFQSASAAQKPVFQFPKPDGEEKKIADEKLAQLSQDMEKLKAEIAILQTLIQTNKQNTVTINPGDFPPGAGKTIPIEVAKNSKPAAAPPPQNAAAVDHGSFMLNGLLHEQYYQQQNTPNSSTYNAKRARIGVKGKANQYAQITILGEFAKSPYLLDASVALTPVNHWTLTVGQFKPPFGTDFLTSAVVIPFVTNSLIYGLGTGYDIGTAVTYNTTVGKIFGVKTTVGLFNGSGLNTADGNSNKNLMCRSEFTLFGKLTAAPNYMVGKTNDTGMSKGNLSAYGGSLTWSGKHETIEAEYIINRTKGVEKSGWYIWSGYLFSTGMKVLPEIQMVSRFEQYDPQLGKAQNRQDRLTIGTNLFVDKKYTKLQFDYQINMRETGKANKNEFLANLQVTF
jgi:hypothetical protein